MILKFIKNLLTARAERAWGEQASEDNAIWYYVGQLLNPETLKRLGIIAAVVAVIVSLIKRWRQISAYRAAVSAEIKKQLEPVIEKLEELQEQNDELMQQNEEIQKQLAE